MLLGQKLGLHLSRILLRRLVQLRRTRLLTAAKGQNIVRAENFLHSEFSVSNIVADVRGY